MWGRKRKFRFFDPVEIFDEPNPGWTLETRVFRKLPFSLFKDKAGFWFIMTFWTLLILQMVFSYIRYYHRIDFGMDEGETNIFPQLLVFFHSFIFWIVVIITPIIFIYFLEPKGQSEIRRIFTDKILEDAPFYFLEYREKDIIDYCIGIENEIDYWWWL